MNRPEWYGEVMYRYRWGVEASDDAERIILFNGGAPLDHETADALARVFGFWRRPRPAQPSLWRRLASALGL